MRIFCLTTEDFINRSKNHPKHKDKYTYNKTIFVSRTEPLIITCKIHGDFYQTPKSHFVGRGCTLCKNLQTSIRCKFSEEEFIEKARKHPNHKNKEYLFDTIVYNTSHDNITVLCKKHGLFELKAYSFLQGIGCRYCGFEKSASDRLKNSEIFIANARKVHGSSFDYSLVIYTGNKNKVTIICPKHGKFEQKPNKHLSGNACPSCKESAGEREIRLCLENLQIDYQKEFKFIDCKYKKPLPFDFAIFDKNKNLIGLIEYQGEQHYFSRKGKWHKTDETAQAKFNALKERFNQENILCCTSYSIAGNTIHP